MIRWSSLLFCSVAAASTDLWEPRMMEAYVDGVMEAQRNAHHYAGAVVVVVREGQVVFSKGYGYSDVAARAPVDPKRTLFRIASNSKMFAWTAIMQLVEQGKLDLHTDVNRYLKGFQIPATFPEPITLEHLMTHTAGFEDKILGLFSHDRNVMRPLAELMRRDLPARVFPPGTVTAYSNYGTALAGLIVEQVSGVPYETYLKQRLLEPLGMAHATLAQPLPAELAGDMSKGYRWSGDWFEMPFDFVRWAPCGGMSVSGEDMARFMIAQMNDGSIGESRILSPETARLMRNKLTSFSPKINGMLHGFFEMNQNGEMIYGHGGDLIWFKSITAMFPERRMGFFVASNTNTGMIPEFVDAFANRFFPQPLPKELPKAKDSRTALARFTGTYIPARMPVTDAMKIGKLAGAMKISLDDDGYLVSAGGIRWRPVEPLVFAQVDGHRRLAFRENSRGEIADACASPICINVMIRQPWWQTPELYEGFLGTFLIVWCAALIGFPIAAVLQRKTPRPRLSKIARLIAWLTSLLFVAGLALVGLSSRDQIAFVYDLPFLFKVSLTLWVVATFGTVATWLFVIAAWRQKWWGVTGRVCLSVVGMTSIVAAVMLNHLNLLGWRY